MIYMRLQFDLFSDLLSSSEIYSREACEALWEHYKDVVKSFEYIKNSWVELDKEQVTPEKLNKAAEVIEINNSYLIRK